MLENRKQFLDDVFDSFTMLAGGNYVSLYDVKAQLTRYSPGAVELFNLPGEYIPDGAFNWSDYVHPEDRKRYESIMGDLIACKTLTYDLTYRVRTRDGNYGLFRFTGAVLRDEEGNPSLIGGMIENEGLMENTDPITVLRNRYGFFNDLDAMLKMNQECVILLIGINKLSQINEEHGYGYGNRLLQQIGWVIQEITGQEGIVYRLEGSRFAFMTRGMSETEAAAVYKKIRQKLQSGVSVDGVRENLSSNGSVMAVKDFTMSDRTVYTCLSYAYKESKERKHGALVSFGKDTGMAERESLELLDTIRTCMIDECQGFYLRYQPVLNLKTEEIAGVEALIRWRDEKHGEVLPERFIPILEQDFAFEELGIWIMRRAMTDGLRFIEKNPDFLVGINISSSQIEDDYFIESLLETAAQTGFPLKNLCLELTKDCRLLDIDMLKEKASALQEKGVKILIDDFGSGFASLEILKGLSADLVKFDMQFVKGITESEENKQDLRRLCELADIHGPNVCVKGVETKEMHEILKTYPIRSIQGYFYSKPVPCEDIIEKYL